MEKRMSRLGAGFSAVVLAACASVASCSSDSTTPASGADGGSVDGSVAADGATGADGSTAVDAQSSTDGATPSDASMPTDASGSDVTSSVDSGDAGACAIGHLVISQVRSRGAAGANDELVELYNATGAAVTLDATWTLSGRTTLAASYTARWAGSGKTIPAYGHYLITGSAFAQMPTADDTLSAGLGDAMSLRLLQGATTIDALCTYYDATTLAAYDNTFTCEGLQASNAPHDDTNGAGSNVDVSLERKPCTDTNVNDADFVPATPAAPRNTASPATP
jgi:hypothetical protein